MTRRSAPAVGRAGNVILPSQRGSHCLAKDRRRSERRPRNPIGERDVRAVPNGGEHRCRSIGDRFDHERVIEQADIATTTVDYDYSAGHVDSFGGDHTRHFRRCAVAHKRHEVRANHALVRR